MASPGELLQCGGCASRVQPSNGSAGQPWLMPRSTAAGYTAVVYRPKPPSRVGSVSPSASARRIRYPVSPSRSLTMLDNLIRISSRWHTEPRYGPVLPWLWAKRARHGSHGTCAWRAPNPELWIRPIIWSRLLSGATVAWLCCTA